MSVDVAQDLSQIMPDPDTHLWGNHRVESTGNEAVTHVAGWPVLPVEVSSLYCRSRFPRVQCLELKGGKERKG
eukprot:7375992-Prymnesium_polylepis.1